MKNSFIKIFLIAIVCLSFFQNSFGDEFNFNVTEIQIYENGNLIKGVNGGTVTSNNDIIITADNFEYNKSTLLLKANGNVKLIDTSQNITIESNEVFYEKDKEKIYTKGKSKASNTANILIFADEYFKYNKLTTLLEAKKNVLIYDKEKDITIKTNDFFYLQKKEKFFTKNETEVTIGKLYTIDTKDLIFLRNQDLLSSKRKTLLKDFKLNNVYKLIDFEYSVDEEILKGKKIEITTKNKKKDSDVYFFETGFFDLKKNKFLAKDVNVKLHKTLFGNNENDPRINAVSGYGDELNTYFEKGVFTSCKKTDKCPPWKIRSNKIRHDKTKKQIIYKDAWLEIYDFPVVYFPKFFHPDPSVKRQSGFLKPDLGSSKTLKDSIYMPYFYVISDKKDITVKPRLFSDNKFILQNEYRSKTKNSLTIADFSITKGHNSDATDLDDTRSHFFSNTKVDLDLKEFIKSDLQINFQKASNDNYLKVFDFLESPLLLNNNDVLESIIRLDLEHQDYDLTSSFEMYETLNGFNSDRYQYVLPTYNFSKNFNLDVLDGSFNFTSYGNNTLSNTNITTSTLSNDLNFTSYDAFFNNGIKTNYEVLFKNINATGKNSSLYKESLQSEIITAYTYNTSLPLIKNTQKSINTLVPKLSLRVSPHDMKNNKALDRRIDVNSIFNSNRLSMGDSFEGGESITLGLDFKKEKVNIKNEITEIEEYLDFKLAKVLRFNEEENIPTTSTLNKKNSNIFGQLKLKATKNISLNYKFSLTDDLNKFEYNSIATKLDFNNFTTQFNFLEERGVIGQTNVIENTTQLNFNRENSILFNTRRNRNLNLTEYYDLIYEYKNDCLVASVQYKKNYYSDADIKPVEELFFSITIIPLTTFSPSKMVLK
jgi:LPS-assembly protein